MCVRKEQKKQKPIEIKEKVTEVDVNVTVEDTRM